MAKYSEYMQFVIVRGEPYLSRCKEWYETYIKNHDTIMEYVQSIGGESFYSFRGARGFNVKFKYTEGNLSRRGPAGWSSPDRRNASCHPKKSTKNNVNPVYEKVMSFEPLPSTYPLYQDIPLSMDYWTDNGVRGHRKLTRNYDPDVGWCELDGEMMFFLHVPKYKEIIEYEKREHREYYNDASSEWHVEKEIENFVLPTSLEPISDKMYEYIFAKSALQKEQKALEAAAVDYAT